MKEAPKNAGLFSEERHVFWLFFFLYFFAGLVFVFLGKVWWGNEDWFFGGSWLVANGEIPYLDFFTHHNPLFFYVYALPQYFFGPSFIVGRLTSLVFMMLTFWLVWRLARKLGGRTAALVAGGLLITNLFMTHYYTTIAYRGLEAFFTLLFFNIMFGDLKDSVKYPLATLMLCLVVGIRYPVDIVSALLVLYFVYLIYRNRHHQRVIWLSLGVAVLSLGSMLLPFIILSQDQYLFSTITFNVNASSLSREFGLQGALDIWNRLYAKLIDLAGVFLYFQGILSVLLGLLLYFLFSMFKSRSAISNVKESISKNQSMIFLLVFLAAYEAFLAVATTEPAPVLRSLTFPAAAVLAGLGLSKVLAGIRDKSAAWLLICLVIALIVVTPLAQYGQDSNSRPAVKWRYSDVKYVLDVSKKVAGYIRGGDRVLTFTPALAFQADRALMPGMLMETFGFFPTWDTARCQKYNLFNESMLLDYLTSREAAAVVLTEDRFYSGTGRGKILDPYRMEILRELEANYYLKETLLYLPGIGQGNVYIYLPLPR